MSTRSQVRWGGEPGGIWPELAVFATSLLLAWRWQWTTSELVWGLWFSGLVCGTVVLLLGATVPVNLPHIGRASGLARAGYYLGLLALGYWILIVPLKAVFPREALRLGPGTAAFWQTLAAGSWPVLLGTLVFERRALWRARREFDSATPFLPYVRTIFVVMLLTPFAIFGGKSGWLSVDGPLGYFFAALVYFSPWRFGREAERS